MLPTEEEISHAKWLGDGYFVVKIHRNYHPSLILEARSILDNDKIERLTERVRDVIKIDAEWIRELRCAASLAHHGLLGSVDRLRLCNDLSQVPAQHLASLASCVTGYLSFLSIKNGSGGQHIISLLASLKCEVLIIKKQSLGREETRALVQAMETNVKDVVLELDNGVTLDIGALTEYSGQGACRKVGLWNDIGDRYREDLRTWARSRNWKVAVDNDRMLFVKKI